MRTSGIIKLICGLIIICVGITVIASIDSSIIPQISNNVTNTTISSVENTFYNLIPAFLALAMMGIIVSVVFHTFKSAEIIGYDEDDLEEISKWKENKIELKKPKKEKLSKLELKEYNPVENIEDEEILDKILKE